jgi:hypothetical protein
MKVNNMKKNTTEAKLSSAGKRRKNWLSHLGEMYRTLVSINDKTNRKCLICNEAGNFHCRNCNGNFVVSIT